MKITEKTRILKIKKMLNLLASVVLLFSLLLSVCACGDTPEESTPAQNESENTPTEPPTEAETEPPETLSEADRLYYDDPEGYLKQYRAEEKTTLNVLSYAGDIVSDYSELDSVPTLKQALYERDVFVQNALNVEFKEVSLGSDTVAQMLERQYNYSDSNFVDIVLARDLDMAEAAINGYAKNLYDYEVFNSFKGSWWQKGILDQIEVNGKLFFAASDISPSNISQLIATHVNTDLAEQNGIKIADLYDHVKNGTWTLDLLYSLSKDIYTDLNNNGEKDMSDLYGASLHTSNFNALRIGAGYTMYEKAEDGRLSFNSTFFGKDFLGYAEKLHGYLHSDDGFHYANYSTADARRIFSTGRCVFYVGTFSYFYKDADEQKTSDFDIAILPVPTEKQSEGGNAEGYSTAASASGWITISIFVKSERDALAAAAIELLSAHSHDKIPSVLFESIFGTTPDKAPEKAQMLELIKGSLVIDYGDIGLHNSSTLTAGDIFQKLLKDTPFDSDSLAQGIDSYKNDELSKLNKAFGFVE